MMSTSVVSLQHSRRFLGTGFVVHTSQQAFLVMTCQHCVQSIKTLQVAFPGQTKTYKAQKVKSGPTDIALLRFVPDDDCRQCVPLRFAQLNTPLNCGEVRMIGYYFVPVGRLLSPGVFDGRTVGEPVDEFVRCDYTSEPGTSGSPVFKGNRVVAVNAQYLSGVRGGISVVSVCTTLRGWLNMDQDSNVGIEDMLGMLAQA